MNDLLEPRDTNMLKILAYIFEKNTNSHSIKEISDCIKIDKRTIITLIDEYNDLFQREPYLELILTREHLIVTKQNNISPTYFYQMLFRNTILFDFCDTLVNRHFTTLLQFANDTTYYSNRNFSNKDRLFANNPLRPHIIRLKVFI